MTTIVVLFNLKPSISKAEYLNWTSVADLPSAGRSPVIDLVELLYAKGALKDNEASPYQYIEFFSLSEAEMLDVETRHQLVQKLAKEFAQITDNPMFLLACGEQSVMPMISTIALTH